VSRSRSQYLAADSYLSLFFQNSTPLSLYPPLCRSLLSSPPVSPSIATWPADRDRLGGGIGPTKAGMRSNDARDEEPGINIT